MLKSKPTLWLILAVALYAVAQLTWFLPTALGQSPVLDGQENLALAQQISDGTLAEEPFYRAILYPFILSWLPFHWAVLGLLAHLANTYLTYRLSLRLWKHQGGALISGALVGFNPVLLHFAFDPLDITIATTFFLLALNFIPEMLSPSRFADRWVSSAGFGFFLSLACLARPHFLAALIPLVIVALCILFFKKKKIEWQRPALFVAFATIPLVVLGFVQIANSGQFKVLPWQGAYNLWVSNNDAANGLYYAQQVEFHYLDEHQNPTRMESETLYTKETGDSGTIDEQSTYWRTKTISYISKNPLQWIKLMAYKGYALLNNNEQYNNKTYSFHKNLSPWLRFNPIGWGVLLTLATIALSTLWQQSRKDLTPFLIIAGLFAAGIVLYMASGRFRIPLVPMLAVFAGGLPFAIKAYKVSSKKIRKQAHIATAVVAFVTFSFFFGINSKETYIQDNLLLADASANLGRDYEAIDWANAALEISPERQAARRILLISRFNLAASGQIQANRAFWNDLAQDATPITLQDPVLYYVRGLIHLNTESDPKRALQIWHEAYDKYGIASSSSLAAIMLTEPSQFATKLTPELAEQLQSGEHSLLVYAIARSKTGSDRSEFLESNQLSEGSFENIDAAMKLLFPN